MGGGEYTGNPKCFSAKQWNENAQQENQDPYENNSWADVTQKEDVIEKEELQQDRARQGSLVTDWPTVSNGFEISHTKETWSLQD
jgi:hypothetical protein